MRLAIVSPHATETNLRLADAAPRGIRSFVIAPEDAQRELDAADAALGRLDVGPTLDGIEDGLAQLELLEARGVAMLNPPLALRLAHDKLATASALGAAALPHPRTRAIFRADEPAPLPFPLVVKPRLRKLGPRRDALPRRGGVPPRALDPRDARVVRRLRRNRAGARAAARTRPAHRRCRQAT